MAQGLYAQVCELLKKYIWLGPPRNPNNNDLAPSYLIRMTEMTGETFPEAFVQLPNALRYLDAEG